MIGAIIGDIIGSYHEFREEKVFDGDFFLPESTFTDDTILSIATADAILFSQSYTYNYQRYFRAYPTYGYGPSFCMWAQISDGYLKENNSWGNGSAMRVSPIGWAFDSVMRVMIEAQQSSSVTHAHFEGIKGAQAVAVAIFMARKGASKDQIRELIEASFEYDCSMNLDQLHEEYVFDVSCQGTVPVALSCVLQADSFEKTMRNGLYVGGDSDTLLAIAGSIAEPLFGVPQYMRDKAESMLSEASPSLLGTVREFEKRYGCGKSVADEGFYQDIIDTFKALFSFAKTNKTT